MHFNQHLRLKYRTLLIRRFDRFIDGGYVTIWVLNALVGKRASPVAKQFFDQGLDCRFIKVTDNGNLCNRKTGEIPMCLSKLVKFDGRDVFNTFGPA